jgi:hypothetical protein
VIDRSEGRDEIIQNLQTGLFSFAAVVHHEFPFGCDGVGKFFGSDRIIRGRLEGPITTPTVAISANADSATGSGAEINAHTCSISYW